MIVRKFKRWAEIHQRDTYTLGVHIFLSFVLITQVLFSIHTMFKHGPRNFPLYSVRISRGSRSKSFFCDFLKSSWFLVSFPLRKCILSWYCLQYFMRYHKNNIKITALRIALWSIVTVELFHNINKAGIPWKPFLNN